MHISLGSNYIEPRTQTPLPNAVLVIVDTEFRMRAGDTRVMAAIYATPSVVGIAAPLSEFPIALGPEERDTQLPSLLAALYQVVLARPEYAGATLVP
jgi:hypothetical protein